MECRGPGRSDWGFFGCERRQHEGPEGGAKALQLRFWLDPLVDGCDDAGSVSIVKPIEGEGTQLMQGDFARRMSPSCEALAWHLLQHRGVFANRRILELGSGLGFSGLALAVWTLLGWPPQPPLLAHPADRVCLPSSAAIRWWCRLCGAVWA